MGPGLGTWAMVFDKRMIQYNTIYTFIFVSVKIKAKSSMYNQKLKSSNFGKL